MLLSEREECVVSGALGVLLRASRWAGTAPLRMQRLLNGTYRICFHRPLHVIASIICVFFNLSTLYWIVTVGILKKLIESPIGKHTPWTLVQMTNLIIIEVQLFIIVCGAERRMKKLMSIVYYMQTQLRKINVEKPKTWKLWMIIFSIEIIYVIPECYGFISNLLNCLIIMAKTNVLLIAAIHQAFLNITLYLYMKTVNKELQELCTSDIDDPSKQEPQPVFTVPHHLGRKVNRLEITEDIRVITVGTSAHTKGHANRKLAELAKAYIAISNVAYNLYESEGGLMLLMISSHVTDIFVNIFHLLSSTIGPQDTSIRVLQISWVLIHTATIVAMIEPCHRLQQEMAQTKAQLSQVISRDNISDDLRKDLDDFFMQLLVREPSCVPMGICTFNRSLLATIAAVGTTLLIIILQFRLSP